MQASLTCSRRNEKVASCAIKQASAIQGNNVPELNTFLQNGQPSNSYSSMGFLGRFLKFLRLSDTKAAVPSLTNAGTPAVAVCRQFLGLFNPLAACNSRGLQVLMKPRLTAILCPGATSYLDFPAAFSSLYLLRVFLASCVCAS